MKAKGAFKDLWNMNRVFDIAATQVFSLPGVIGPSISTTTISIMLFSYIQIRRVSRHQALIQKLVSEGQRRCSEFHTSVSASCFVYSCGVMSKRLDPLNSDSLAELAERWWDQLIIGEERMMVLTGIFSILENLHAEKQDIWSARIETFIEPFLESAQSTRSKETRDLQRICPHLGPLLTRLVVERMGIQPVERPERYNKLFLHKDHRLSQSHIDCVLSADISRRDNE